MKQSFTTGMCSDDLAGDAERRVPIPNRRNTYDKCSDDMASDAKRRVPIPK